MTRDTPRFPGLPEDHLLYSPPDSLRAEWATTPRLALWALAMSLVALAGCDAQTRAALPALLRAAEAGRTDEVRALLAAGEDPNRTDASGHWTALTLAAGAGHLETMRALLAGRADPNWRGARETEWTPLLHAIHRNRLDAVEVLLAGGADVNLPLVCGRSPLKTAAGHGNTVMVRRLLDAGAEVSERALAAAISGVPDIDRFTLGHCQTDTVRALVERAPQAAVAEATDRLYLRVAGWLGCDEVVRLVESHQRPRPPTPE
jgi:hypothetical protein